MLEPASPALRKRRAQEQSSPIAGPLYGAARASARQALASRIAFLYDGRRGRISALDGPHEIGYMLWDTDHLGRYRGEILSVYVSVSYRRLGVATLMLREARRRSRTKIRHSPSRTSAGDAWAASLGEILPELET